MIKCERHFEKVPCLIDLLILTLDDKLPKEDLMIFSLKMCIIYTGLEKTFNLKNVRLKC